ncbi:MAG: tRNA-dihydrouridine synthase, partial [Bacilli bacterium]|nr:tRNA-dihydrouridine synthase [Bacilli bacterium]
MNIGGIEIKGHVVLAPMAGVSTLAYREFMKPFGVGLSYSEMVSDCGIDYKNEKTYTYLASSKIDQPFGIQLFGFAKENTVKAIGLVEEEAEYDILDINLGCPVYKVTKTGSGSAWLKRPQELYEYMRAIVIASHKPVTAKIRLGWDEDYINVHEVVSLLEKAGVAGIAIHARTSKQGYTGAPDFGKIANLREQMSVPLIVSGNIFSVEDAARAVEITKADAVMVARGGVGNPFLITQINHFLDTGERLPDPGVLTQVDYAEDYAKRLIELKGEAVAIRELRGILPKFFSGFPGYKKVRLALTQNVFGEASLFALLN